MTIKYDPALRRATHVESGLAVQWLRDEPALERRTHFKLIIDDREVPFEAWYDFGERKIESMYPYLHFLEQNRLISDLMEKNYKAYNIPGEFDRGVFVNVWQFLASYGHEKYKISVLYKEFGPGTDVTIWECNA